MRLFKWVELETNFRQREDDQFASFLNKLRVGNISSEVKSVLNGRLCKNHKEEEGCDIKTTGASILTATNLEKDEYNNIIIENKFKE
jgi:hypothetical protein